MNYLFVHQNMPAQFKYLAPALAQQPDNRVVFLTRRRNLTLPNIECITYGPTRSAHNSTHHYVRLYENSVLHGQQVVRECLRLRQAGFVPDIIIAHPGWGEALFLKDVFPHVPLLNYCEYYYHGVGADVGFDPQSEAGLDGICRARARNAHLLLSLETCDHGLSPTYWQRDRHPAALRQKISVVFDGIDTDIVRPADSAHIVLPDGARLTSNDHVVTYIARNLEPYRGFPSFMRAVPKILAGDASAHVVIVGGDAVSYGQKPAKHKTWLEAMLEELGPLDLARVHICGQLPYSKYLLLLQVSTVHVYLTVPFVLSWSCMEALGAGCLVVGSRTPPVEEVIEHGRNGLLVDFHNPDEIAATVCDAITHARALAPIRQRARQIVKQRYDLAHCLPAQMRLIASLM